VSLLKSVVAPLSESFSCIKRYYRDFIVIPTAEGLPELSSAAASGEQQANRRSLSLFLEEQCLAEVRADCQDFLREFFRTQMFSCFITSRLTRTSDDLFDIAIQRKAEMVRVNLGPLPPPAAGRFC